MRPTSEKGCLVSEHNSYSIIDFAVLIFDLCFSVLQGQRSKNHGQSITRKAVKHGQVSRIEILDHQYVGLVNVNDKPQHDNASFCAKVDGPLGIETNTVRRQQVPDKRTLVISFLPLRQ